MKKVALLLCSLCVTVHTTIAQNSGKKIPNKLVFEVKLPDSLRNALREGHEIIVKKYGPLQPVIVKEAQSFAEEKGFQTVAYSLPGEIFLNKKCNLTIREAKNIGEHESFHAAKPRQYTMLRVPIKLYDGYILLGFNGLSTVERDSTGGISHRLFIEESCAEMCAHKADKGYMASSKKYWFLGSFMTKIVDSGWMTSSQIFYWQKSNGLKEFCAALLNRDETLITDPDVVVICDMFASVTAEQNSWIPAIKFLSKERRKYNK